MDMGSRNRLYAANHTIWYQARGYLSTSATLIWTSVIMRTADSATRRRCQGWLAFLCLMGTAARLGDTAHRRRRSTCPVVAFQRSVRPSWHDSLARDLGTASCRRRYRVTSHLCVKRDVGSKSQMPMCDMMPCPHGSGRCARRLGSGHLPSGAPSSPLLNPLGWLHNLKLRWLRGGLGRRIVTTLCNPR